MSLSAEVQLHKRYIHIKDTKHTHSEPLICDLITDVVCVTVYCQCIHPLSRGQQYQNVSHLTDTYVRNATMKQTLEMNWNIIMKLCTGKNLDPQYARHVILNIVGASQRKTTGVSYQRMIFRIRVTAVRLICQAEKQR